MIKYLYVVLLCSVMISCAKNNDQSAIKFNTEEFEIDLDEDGVNDFVVLYDEQVAQYPTNVNPWEVNTKSIKALGTNLILKKEEERALFLEDINELNINVNAPLTWSNSQLALVTINKPQEESDWPSNWQIFTDTTKTSYLIGLKLIQGSESNLGYIEISIDDKTSAIELLNKVVL